MNNIIKDTMIVKFGNPELADKFFEMAEYDIHMKEMINIWYNVHHIDDIGEWLFEELTDYYLDECKDEFNC